MARNSTLSFHLSPISKYELPIEMWMRALACSRGMTVSVSINGKQSSYSLFSQHPKFSLFKIFDGKFADAPSPFCITNVNGKNYIEGIYVIQRNHNYENVDRLFNSQNITDINFNRLNFEKHLVIDRYATLDPTLWNFKVSNVSKPFTIGFAEPFDSSWEARVYKDGKKIDTVHSLPL